MKAVHFCLFLHVFSTASVLVNAFHPIIKPTVVSIGVGALAWSCNWVYKYLHECCDPKWISFNATALQANLDSKLFGQHIASPIILKAVNGFMTNDNPKKPLVLSLHGWTGTRKNFVSQLIAESIYKEGMDSSFVHVFRSDLHFPHSSRLDTYKSQLQRWIKGNVTNCARSMFIFDEVDKMPPGLIYSIKPYLEYYNKLDGVSYRKSIFILLSNAGGESITQTALDFWKEGRTREDIKLRDLERSLSLSAFSDKSVIDRHLVDFFVPFLPLERKHVVKCVIAEMRARGLKPIDLRVADKVVSDLVFFPKTDRVFSASGCKTITGRFHFYV